MDRLYSKSALIIKAAFCVILAPLYMLLSNLLYIEDGFLFILVTVIPIGCLFTLPFWLTAFHLLKYRVKKIGRFILLDAAVCLAPALISTVFCELVYVLINGKTAADGILTIIFASIFFIISLIFWLLYFISSRIK